MTRGRALGVAASLALPVVLVAAMAGQAEWALRGGTPVRVPITGYDPSDPIRGHFLRYRFAWNWEGDPPGTEIAALCVVSGRDNPVVRPVADDAGCALPIRLQPGSRSFQPVGVSDALFVPEDKAPALQSALQDRSADLTVTLSVAADGSARVSAWQVDGADVAAWRR